MTPMMLRSMAYAAWAVMLAVAAVWLLQAAGLVELIDDPLVGMIGFGLLGLGLAWLASRGPARAK